MRLNGKRCCFASFAHLVLGLAAAALLASLLPARAAAAAGSGAEGTGAAPAAGLEITQLPVVEFPAGANIKDLPGASQLLPEGPVTDIRIALVPAVVQGPTGSKTAMLRFANSLYRNDETGETYMFGPTLRLKAGDKMKIWLKNELVAGHMEEHGQELHQGFHGPMDTNIHTHGLHDAPGMQDQSVPVKYTGNDNIFVVVSAKPNATAPASELLFEAFIPDNHLPGFHWVHPHKHGSTMLQSITSSLAIVVEDDPKWLPDDAGCADIREALSAAQEVILHLEIMIFGPHYFPFPDLNDVELAYEDANVQFYSKEVQPTNPLCCGGTPGSNDVNSLPVSGNMTDVDWLLVNGGWNPVLDMTAGKWQRWRLVHAGVKRYVEFQIVNPDTWDVVEDCSLMLVAKDGVYMLQIPRQVNHIYLPSGARAELLVKCATPGTYIVTGDPKEHGFGDNEAVTIFNHLKQSVVMTLNVTKPAAGVQLDADLDDRACTPLRPAYATDVRDASLAAHGASDKLLTQNVTFYNDGTDQKWGCLVNGKNFSFPDKDPLVVPVGSVMEWEFDGLVGHPLHLHVSPFQIAELPDTLLRPNTTFSTWFEEGDFHDTLLMPQILPRGIVRLRVQPGSLAGYSVMHCHFLHHEDMGCMKVVKFDCPGVPDPQPLFCPVPDAVPGDVAETRSLGPTPAPSAAPAGQPAKAPSPKPAGAPETAKAPAPAPSSGALQWPGVHAHALLAALLAAALLAF